MQAPLDSTKASLERIKKQLTTSGRFLLQGSLLKRSETLRKWNQRWFTLDPTTGKMEYRVERGDIAPKGSIIFDAGSSIIVSPINLQGSIKYDRCCIYIQTSTKKEYFLCAETPGAAQAWVSTLRAAQLVLKAHKEAMSSLAGNGSSTVGTVAAVVAAANAIAKEAAKEVAPALPSSVIPSNAEASEGIMDNLSIMKETLKVKDDELHQMAKDMRARDETIKELAERLTETAKAAKAAALAAHTMDKERKTLRSEITKLRMELEEKLQLSSHELKETKVKLAAAEKARDEALKEAQLWRVELAKARDRAVIMEAVLVRAEETARRVSAAAEVKAKTCLSGEAAIIPPQDVREREVGEFISPSEGHVAQSHETVFEARAALNIEHNGITMELLDNNAPSVMHNGIGGRLHDSTHSTTHNSTDGQPPGFEFVNSDILIEKERTQVSVDALAFEDMVAARSIEKVITQGTLDEGPY